MSSNPPASGNPAPAGPAAPLVTIVLPVYNGERFLREAIDSVLAQTLADWELLVGDDQSTDASEKIIATYPDQRVRYRKNPTRRGIFGNLNDLIGTAQSDYVKIFCQDDVLEPACLERQLRFMRERPQLAFARVLERAGKGVIFDEQDEGLRSLPEVIPPCAAALAFFIHGNIPGNLSNNMVRASSWRRWGKFREDLPYAGDMEFWFRIAAQEPFGVVPERLNFVRSHPGQASVALNRRNELIGQSDQVLEAIYRALPASLHGRFSLRLWGSANYVVQGIHRGMRLLWRGQSPNLRALGRRRRYAYGLPLSFSLYLLTGNRRWGIQPLRRRLLKKLQRMLDEEPPSRA